MTALPSDAAAAQNPHPRPLLVPMKSPIVQHSSPHMTDFAGFSRIFGASPRRRMLLDTLLAELRRIAELGIVAKCLLVGGGFVRLDRDPGDIDGLVAYQPDAAAIADPARLALLRRPVPGLDLRYVPADAGPAVLIKMSCFFHTLYQSHDKDGDRGGERGSYLVSFGGESCPLRTPAAAPSSPSSPSSSP